MKTTVLLLGFGAVAIGALIFAAQHESGRARAPRTSARVDPLRGATTAEIPSVVEQPAAPVDSTPAQPSIDEVVRTAEPPRIEKDAWRVGVEAYERGDLQLAVTALEQAVDEREDSAYRHYLLGLCYRRIGEPEGAVQEFERSLALASEQPRAYAHLGRAWLDLGETSAAREAVDEGLGHDLEFADLWQVLGRIELSEGRLDEAAAAFERTTELDPAHAWAWNNLGYVRILQGRHADAVPALQRAVSDERAESSFFNNLAHALEGIGELVQASEAFARAGEMGHQTAASSQQRLLALLEADGELYGPALLAESN